MTWTYEVMTRKFSLNGEFKFYAQYAGAVGYQNNTKFECLKDKGPLPRGKYKIGAPYASVNTGRYTIPLTPTSTGNMCNRDAFKIHGDSLKNPGKASKGCIIANPKYREEIWNSGDRELIVQ
ncbi:tlde1 domain-containing protein [Serratia plymuthica]|jgi:hypothetical protein|uniref:tlde1 domain-containing protein n=1 Tax=Serratia plymuthica TaxID=82996 RepID=UPI003DA40939